MIQNNERFRLVIGGPGDGKTVLLQQMGWNKRSEENEVTTILSARRLARKEYMLVFSMHEGEQKASMFSKP